MRIALAQLNPTVGDVAGNAALVLDAMKVARAEGADLVLCSELVLLGYPPRDLIMREGVVEACEDAAAVIAEHAGDLTVVVGHPRRCPDGVRSVRNSASVVRNGVVEAFCDKRLLPGYDIFDEDRYFDAGVVPCVFEQDGVRIGVLCCEDLWRAGDVVASPHYAVEPLRDLVEAGCRVVLVLNASPFISGKFERHLELVRTAAREHAVAIVVVNQVGANDDLVFDGRSIAVHEDGTIAFVLPGWESAVQVVEVGGSVRGEVGIAKADSATAVPWDDLWHALVLGVRDYCRKSGHERVLIGLSGGIDSALTATIAAAALGPACVAGVMMPSRFSSDGSVADARDLAGRLGMAEPEIIPIEPLHEAMASALVSGLFARPDGVTDENLQARLRGVLLMARSNATGALVLATSNKSELAVGYSTLYGDMCGAISVLGDLVKTRVYGLARWINANHAKCGFDRAPIPESSIEKPPSAELRSDQTDQDSLPPYEVLDEIIERVVDLEQSAARIVAETGFAEALVGDIYRMIDRAEYKRHQAAIILKVTQRAFGRGRTMPIVSGTI